ncbi:FkbM family methyltransferase [Tychonema sp. LEGE 07203]|uniref:FkbM family methyltransferase n=1 Tax=Tychonema sp. LEGE 07203 TaxID=1828671 RepID=UPI00188198A7|nr:FkbM family methyltransferase [Tychonema sp. LEGE 07203]MBE9096151.1 FkbM family methyltransferase [Tychonema sp. LEGE 07203]
MFFLPSLKKSGHLDRVHITVCIVGSRKIEKQDDYASQNWDIFAPNLTIYGFDADVEACSQANAELEARKVNWNEKHIPSALSNTEGKATLYVTKYPGCSSLYPPSEDYIKRFSGNSELIELKSTVDLSTTTLEKFCKAEGIKEIDFLHLDVQGGELNVLQGADGILNNSVLGLITEVEFTEIYAGQPLFSDVDIYLRNQGLTLFDFGSMYRDRRRDIPVISQSHPGALIWSDAFYFRDLMRSDLSPSLKTPEKLLKLACLADVMKFPDYALEILHYLTLNHGSDPKYNFANNIIESLGQVPELTKQGLESLPIVARLREYISLDKGYIQNTAEPIIPDLETTWVRNWKLTFIYKGKHLPYNRIGYNNTGERAIEIPIALNFIATLEKKDNILEVGNTLSHYENSLSEYIGIRPRRIVDKFEVVQGVDNVDFMDIPSEEKYDVIVSVSTVEHIGQGIEPSSQAYGEQIQIRDMEMPLKAIAKIYDLLAIGGKAFITVPFGKLIDGGWYIQFDRLYLETLTTKYQIPPAAISTVFMRILDMEVPNNNPREIWIEEQKENLQNVEYNYPYPCANAIALIELNKLSEAFSLNLDVPSTALTYHQPVCERATFFPELIKNGFLLLLSKLRDINLICFPDWEQPEESLCSYLEKVISLILTHPDRSRMTLLIYRSNISEEDANLVLAGATMNVFMEEQLEVDDEPEFHLMENISQVEWAALIPRVCSEIVWDDSNKQASAKLESKNIPVCELENFSKQRIVQLETGAFVLR